MDHLGNLPSRISITPPTDDSGFTGRECPNADCQGYFKIVFGTGLEGEDRPCHCPYCGHTGPHDEFFTHEQIEYAKSVALRQVVRAFSKDLKSLEFEQKPRGAFGIGLSLKVKEGPPIPIFRYREKQLETDLVCGNCTLRYSVYGVFAYCPDCGQHNSLQIFQTNLDVVKKILDLAEAVDREVGVKLLENALEDCVSAFDGYGREFCRVYRHCASAPEKISKMNFQNLEHARERVRDHFAFDLTEPVSGHSWQTAVNLFQKRHLIAHKMGVVDQEYIDRTADSVAVVGRKIVVEDSEVRELIGAVSAIAGGMLRNVRDKAEFTRSQ